MEVTAREEPPAALVTIVRVRDSLTASSADLRFASVRLRVQRVLRSILKIFPYTAAALPSFAN
jgi:hypothetical protein